MITKKRTSIMFITIFFCSGIVLASDLGCKFLMCISNPGGATEFEECVEPVETVRAKVKHGHPIPPCDMEEGSGVSTDEGVEPYYHCEETYGPGWIPTTRTKEGKGDQDDKIIPNCSKLTGYRRVKVCNQNDKQCKMVDKPIYITEDRIRRDDPNWIQVTIAEDPENGTEEYSGPKFYYSTH